MKNQSKLSLQVDLVFKAMFGRDTAESNYLLVDLLNTILGRQGEQRIKSVTIQNPFNTKESS